MQNKALENKMREALKHFSEQQESGTYDHPCPRCGHKMDLDRMVMNPVSRYEDIYICSNCGIDEAMRDWKKMDPIPLTEWAFSTIF